MLVYRVVRESCSDGGGESKHVCPKCGKTSNWKSRDCGHCGYEFGSDERNNERRIREDERERIKRRGWI